MANQQELARAFHALHVKSSPVILFNIWDPGSAQAVASQGAKAIATGSHGVANAFGYEDGEKIPLDLALENAARVVKSTDLPVTMDIETGYGVTADEVEQNALKVIQTGIVGMNLEDQNFTTNELRATDEQVDRIAAIRRAAVTSGVDIFINARTDLFKNTDVSTHNDDLVDQALERAQAYADAGASGFFVPLLQDINLISRLCKESPLPVNIIMLPGMVSSAELATAGVSRISYGPFPYLDMIEWLKKQASAALVSV